MHTTNQYDAIDELDAMEHRDRARLRDKLDKQQRRRESKFCARQRKQRDAEYSQTTLTKIDAALADSKLEYDRIVLALRADNHRLMLQAKTLCDEIDNVTQIALQFADQKYKAQLVHALASLELRLETSDAMRSPLNPKGRKQLPAESEADDGTAC